MNSNNLIHLSNISNVLTLDSALKKDGRNLNSEDINIVKNTSIIASKDEILYVGNDQNLINNFKNKNILKVDLADYSVTPELIDSHTHLIFGGNRCDEYVMRLNGADYEEIAKANGGITHTSNATNNEPIHRLIESARERIEKIYSYGVGTIEIKSGYGLNLKKEIELSNAIHQLKLEFSPRINIVNTFMAAHAIPKNINSSDEYIEKICIPAMEQLASLKIIDYVDIFHEKNYFTEKNVRDLYHSAKKFNIPMRVHADEFHDNNGGSIAAELNFHSADHLLSISKKGIEDLSKTNTVATLLPGTGYFLGKKQAPARELLDSGCKVAIASDFNPGSCHLDNLLFIANLAAPNYKMNQAELWAAITLNAANSLGLKNQGAIVKGFKPRFSFFKTKNLNEVNYSWMTNFSQRVKEVDQFFYGKN